MYVGPWIIIHYIEWSNENTLEINLYFYIFKRLHNAKIIHAVKFE